MACKGKNAWAQLQILQLSWVGGRKILFLLRRSHSCLHADSLATEDAIKQEMMGIQLSCSTLLRVNGAEADSQPTSPGKEGRKQEERTVAAAESEIVSSYC